MFKKVFATACLFTCLLGNEYPASADTLKAYCTYSPHDHTMEMLQGECTFTQLQGNVYINMQNQSWGYPASLQGETYTRVNRSEGIWFHTEGDNTMVVLWEKPNVNCEGNQSL